MYPLSTVAVVDGRRSFHDLITAALRAVGYPVIEYESRSAFLVAYPWEKPRIVVMGAHNDGTDLSQEQAVKHLLIAHPASLLPILLFGPGPDDPALIRAAAIPGTEVLPLPLTEKGIVDAVQRVGGRSLSLT